MEALGKLLLLPEELAAAVEAVGLGEESSAAAGDLESLFSSFVSILLRDVTNVLNLWSVSV